MQNANMSPILPAFHGKEYTIKEQISTAPEIITDPQLYELSYVEQNAVRYMAGYLYMRYQIVRHMYVYFILTNGTNCLCQVFTIEPFLLFMLTMHY